MDPWDLPAAPTASSRGAHPKHEWALVLGEVPWMSSFQAFWCLLIFWDLQEALHGLCSLPGEGPGLTGFPALYSASSSPALLVKTAVSTRKVTGLKASGYLFVFVFSLLLDTNRENFGVQSQTSGLDWAGASHPGSCGSYLSGPLVLVPGPGHRSHPPVAEG